MNSLTPDTRHPTPKAGPIPSVPPAAPRTGRAISAGAIYTALERMEARGFVSSRLGEATEQRRGRPKKFYRLESAGAEALDRSYSAFARMAKGMGPKLANLISEAEHSGA